jgi:hypothetical protein
MRSDMSKVIVERPRLGSSRRTVRRFRRFDPRRFLADEDGGGMLPACIGHKRYASLGGRRKCLNENLAPLRRYLGKQVGRPWDDVFSEVSEHISLDNTVQKHVRDHLQDLVACNTRLHEGSIHFIDRWDRLVPLATSRWMKLYVDPATRLLCRIERRPTERARRRAETIARQRALTARMRWIDADRQLHLLDDGNWWEVALQSTWKRTPGRLNPPAVIVDVVERAELSSLPRAERYDCGSVFAIAKRALSRKEIKSLRLRTALR